jgi:long-chain acyl-CoA synthetase
MQYKLDQPDNLIGFLEDSVARFPERPLFGTRTPEGEYEWITYRDFGRRVNNLRGGLAAIGVGKGDMVGIIANNRVEWAAASFATHGLNARFVPMYEQELLHVWEYIIRDSGIKVLFVSKPAILEQVREFPARIDTLKKIVLIEGEGPDTMAALEKTGEKHPVPAVRPAADDIATLIYTSGTTGDPKGVLLSHGNWTHNSHCRVKRYPGYDENDRVLSILPWAHTYGQGEMHTFLQIGASIALMGSTATLAGDMAKTRPTFIVAVPRVFNKIYEGLWAKMDATGGLARKLFVMGVEAGKKRRALAEKGRPDFLTNLKFRIADRVVFAKIRERFGGRLRAAMTASAMMNMEILLFFLDLGIPVYDCYGMTETSPAIAVNGPAAWRIGSVGKPIEQVRVVIDSSVVEEGAQDGEIVCYGPNVMKGYHNKPEQTKEVMTEDGGIRTGDRGRLDKDGFLFITGRIKEQFKLENGKFVFPAALEEDIMLLPSIDNVMVYGENRLYTIALVVPSFFALERFAEAHGLPTDVKALIARDDVREMTAREIQDGLKGKFGGYEIPKKVILLTEGFSLENGTLTQTMKLKRRVVLKKYEDLIEAAYNK